MQDHNEPEDFCRTCHCFFTLSQLRKHIADGCQDASKSSCSVPLSDAPSLSTDSEMLDSQHRLSYGVSSEDQSSLFPVYDIPDVLTTYEVKSSADTLL